MSQEKKTKPFPVTTNLDEATYRKLQEAARKKDRPLGWLIRQMIEQRLRRPAA